jgi:hypothetical protein
MGKTIPQCDRILLLALFQKLSKEHLHYSRSAEGVANLVVAEEVPDLVVEECHPLIVNLYRKLEGQLHGAQLSWS